MKYYVIAELGCNHQGDIEIAKKMIDEAAKAGANAVKVQKRSMDALNEYSDNKVYDGPNSFGKTYTEHRKALELTKEQHKELSDYARNKGLDFGASCWDKQSIDDMEDIIDFYKLQSADSHNYPLIEYLAKKTGENSKHNKGLPVIMSTGGSTYDEITKAVNIFDEQKVILSILHCVPVYPAPFNSINLQNILKLKELFPDKIIGYSGHEKGIAISVAAAAMGARIIERHFTLDRTMKGGDHSASLEPQGLTLLVRDLRALEESIGSPERIITDEQKQKLDSLNLTRKPFNYGEN